MKENKQHVLEPLMIYSFNKIHNYGKKLTVTTEFSRM